MENESGWISMKQFKYLAGNPSITVPRAAYNESSNSINIMWTTPSVTGLTSIGVRLSVNGAEVKNELGTGNKSYTIANVPHINDSGIRSGQPVRNVS
jgi:hypothetical protein